MKEEVWKELESWPGYHISNFGRVYNALNGRMVKSSPNKKGHVYIHLKRDGKDNLVLLPRLVAVSFLEGYFEGAEVKFKDGNRENLHVDNLEWVTHWENNRWNTGRRNWVRKAYYNRKTGELEWDDGTRERW